MDAPAVVSTSAFFDRRPRAPFEGVPGSPALYGRVGTGTQRSQGDRAKSARSANLQGSGFGHFETFIEMNCLL